MLGIFYYYYYYYYYLNFLNYFPFLVHSIWVVSKFHNRFIYLFGYLFYLFYLFWPFGFLDDINLPKVFKIPAISH
jgi:hypothetical protein